MLLALVNKCALCLFYFRSTVGLHISQLLARIIYQFPHFLWSFVTFSGTRFCGFVIFVFAYFILFSNIKRVFNLDIWLPGMMHTGEIDSALWCTPAEIDSTVGCKPRSFLKIWISQPNRRRIQKYFSLSCPCKWVRIMEKIEVKNLVTHSLTEYLNIIEKHPPCRRILGRSPWCLRPLSPWWWWCPWWG